MRKKIFSALMLVALTLAATSTLVSCKDYDDDIAAVNTRIDNLDSSLKQDLANVKSDLASAKEDYVAKINTLRTELIAADATLESKLQGKIDIVDGKVTTNTGDIATLKGQMAQAIQDIQANATLANANQTAINQLVNVTIPALEGRIATLEAFKTTAETKLAALENNKADKTALQAAINDAAAADAAIRGEISAAKTELNGNISAAKTELNSNIDAAKQALQIQIDANKLFCQNLSKWNRSTSDSLAGLYTAYNEKVKKIDEEIGKINQKFNDYTTTEDLKKDLNALHTTITGEINAEASALRLLIERRLTSMYFQPKTFIDGIECIEFASLDYNEWKNFYADKADQKVATYIDDASAEAIYHFNPASVTKDDVKDLQFISSIATNTNRAADGVVVTVKDWTLANGTATLKLTKNTKAVNNTNKDFTIVALQAEIAKKNLTGENVNPYVYSDWARLYETSKTPYIHNVKAVDAKGNPVETAKFAHFYKFSDIYNQYTGTNSEEALHYKLYTTAMREPLLENAYYVAYNEKFDLSKIAMVCDQDGNKIDAAAYGLEFQYETVECYNIKNEGSTDDATNQCCYTSKAEANPVVYSLSPDKYPHQNNPANFTKRDNRDAIGKTPVYMIRLYDKVNKKVVDVKYVMICWTEAKREPVTLAQYEKDVRFDCGEHVVATLGEDYLNYMAAQVDLEGSKELGILYHFGDVAYNKADVTAADAIVLADVEVKMNGTVTGQVDNVKVLVKDPMVLNYTLCETGKEVKMYYIPVYDIYNRLSYVVPVKITTLFSNQTKLNDEYKKISDYWKDLDKKADAYVVANPTLRVNSAGGEDYSFANGYTDTQLLQDILDDYAKGTVSPKRAIDLTKNLDEADMDHAEIVFDETRIKAMMGATWNVKDNGLKLYDGDVLAATLQEGKIQLYEGATPGKNGAPTSAAKAFVAYEGATASKNAIPVMLVATQCQHQDTLDSYMVKFEKPLEFTQGDKAFTVTDQLLENTTGQFVEIRWNKLAKLVEAFGNKATIIDANTYNSDMAKWYIVKNLNIKLADAKFTSGFYKGQKLNAVLNNYGTPKYEVKWTAGNPQQTAWGKDYKGRLGWYNNSGNALTEDVTVEIPVELVTKWRTWTWSITLTIKQNTTTAK